MRQRYPLPVILGGLILIVLILVTIFGPWFVENPYAVYPLNRLKPPSSEFWFGTDFIGRDVFARVVYGGRVSLLIGALVVLFSVISGVFLGLIAGYIRILNPIIMRTMDGLMAIPEILLAIALISLVGASVFTLVVAIAIPQAPLVVRLVNSIVLSVREEPYIEAAIASGTRTPKIIMRHILPNIVGPIIVKATFIFGAAILIEALLGFLGAGIPPEIPSWGNIMAEGRTYFQLTPWLIFIPGACISATILAANIMGDGLREILDPRFNQRN